MKKYFSRIAKLALVLVYLVIIAGALVRMTGSGMGCPDWPKCFGYYIPPTDIKELTWSPNRDFEKNQVIIKDEKLLVAVHDFTTTQQFNSTDWRFYTKHDYAIFNPKHTWIEYINRLLGALAGIVILIMSIASFTFWKQNKKIVFLSWLSTFLMGFQGWLGATVVYSVLNPFKITLHMLVALVIVAVLLYIIQNVTSTKKEIQKNTLFRNILYLGILLSLIQIILGTQVRQYVDEQVKIVGYNNMNLVFKNPYLKLYIHRSFSLLILGVNLFLYLKNKKSNLGYRLFNWIIILIFIEITSGIALYYFDFPFGSQPIHLVVATVLFGLQFYESIQKVKTIN
jgi:cytochrome c oxidase assembly protein subunit 15